MLDMGFKPQVDRIVRRVPRDRQTMFFSATLDATVNELARAYTTDPLRCDAQPAPETEGGPVEHRFVEVRPETKVETLVGMLLADGQRTLVFVRTKRGADRLVRKLAQHGVRAVAMHGDLSQGQRERALRRFESGQSSTLVATDVAARGIDLVDVTHVVNYDPPEEHAGYVHRVGRTGRAGRSGVGVTLVLPEQRESVSRVARLAGQAEEFTKAGMQLAPPKLVYSSRRGRSKWGTARPARKI
jgi:superfamily II DNA/RNA helicase